MIVGNVGTVYSGDAKGTAKSTYNTYKGYSKQGMGRVAGEPVTLMCDGEIELEHLPDGDDE